MIIHKILHYVSETKKYLVEQLQLKMTKICFYRWLLHFLKRRNVIRWIFPLSVSCGSSLAITCTRLFRTLCQKSKTSNFLKTRHLRCLTGFWIGLPFYDWDHCHIENSPLSCSANHWPGFYMIETSCHERITNHWVKIKEIIDFDWSWYLLTWTKYENTWVVPPLFPD